MQPGSVRIPFSTYFHHNTPEFDYSLDVTHQKYRFIAEKYKKFKILIFNHDLFLKYILKQQKNDILKELVNKKENSEIEKAHIVETLFAHMTKAYFGNSSPRNAIEKEISNKIEKNEIKIKN